MIMKPIKHPLLSKIASMFISNIYGKLILLISNLVLANLLGAAAYGEYIYIFNFFAILSIAPLMGIERGILNYIPKLEASKDKLLSEDKLISFSLLVVGLLSFLTSLLTYVGAEMVSTHLLKNPSAESIIRFFALYIMFINLYKIVIVIFQAKGNVKWFGYGLNVIEPTLFLVFTIIIFYFNNTELASISNQTIVPVLGRYLAIGVSLICMYLILVKKYRFQFTVFFTKIQLQEIKIFMKFSFPLLLVTAIGVLMSKIDILMLGAHVDTSKIAYYNAAAQYAMLGVFSLTAVNQVFVPQISKHFARNEMDELRKKYGHITLILLLISIITFGLVFIFGEYMLGFYGDEFKVAYHVLLLLMMGQTINAICGPSGYLVAVMISPLYDLYINVFSILINIVINLILIPIYGIEGAAFGTMISFIFSNLIKVFVLNQKFGIKPLKI